LKLTIGRNNIQNKNEMSVRSSQIIHNDALTALKQMRSNLVDCVITSPPYWALRDYKTDGQLGLEPTFTEYIDKLVEIFDEIKRVLKDTGTCFVVM
jgi:DNA modification methylase